ncbi:FAD/NAD-P-binding domain-containing protein [Trametopsis cervina]|nr:FAD/NAD-P-binding domain-containing protein [Trametopsis cervina]
MSQKKLDEKKKNIVVVGGGFAGIAAVKELATKVDHAKYNVVLVTPRPYNVHLLALIRMTVSDIDDLGNQALIPYDRLQGVFHQIATVTSIEETAPGEGGNVVFATGERLSYAALLLATGAIWSGPLAIGDSDKEIRQHLKEWQSRFASARHVVIGGGGAVGIETVGEIKDVYPDTKVTLVHSQSQLVSEIYPDKFRRKLDAAVRGRGAEIIYSDYIDVFPEPGQTVDITTRRGKTIKGVDLVVPAFGSRPNTAFISSLGSGVLTESGTVKVKPTLELLHHKGIWAAGDIIEWAEAKQAAKAPNHSAVAAANILSFLGGRPQTKVYKGSMELIAVPVGKKYGASYFNVLWGICFGNWLTSLAKGKTLIVPKARSDLNY